MQPWHVPTLLPGAAFAGGRVVMVTTGGGHTVVVTSKGVLWSRGNYMNGQLGIAGLEQFYIEPALVEAEDVFGGSQVRMAACGDEHTLVLQNRAPCGRAAKEKTARWVTTTLMTSGCQQGWRHTTLAMPRSSLLLVETVTRCQSLRMGASTPGGRGKIMMLSMHILRG